MKRELTWCSCVMSVALAVSMNGFASRPSVTARFSLATPEDGPFPSDRFTVPDPIQHSGLRVSMPLPDCGERPSDCQDLAVINTLDGFNLQPRLSIPFDAPIDVATVTSQTVFLISLGSTTERSDDPPGTTIGINQVVWDVATATLHVEADDLLAQHTRYALIVTNGIEDASGNPVQASDAFRRFRQTVRGEYKHALLEAIHASRRLGVREDDIVAASVFTTESATATLEEIRDQIKAATPKPADFLLLGRDGIRTVFRFDDSTRIAFVRQVTLQPSFSRIELNLNLLRIFPGAVSLLAFGKYESPDYMAHPGEYMPALGGTPAVQGTNEIFFNLVLPSRDKPSGGWPVAIFGHGGGQSKNFALPLVAGVMAQQGLATIMINSVGHGFGPLSTLEVTSTIDGRVVFPAGGRGIDQDGNGAISNPEGMAATSPFEIVGFRDGFRQTAVDLMQLVRVIEVGMDVDGDGVADLDPSRIYYFGQSQGGNYGTLLLALEPAIRAGVLNVPGSPLIDNERLSASRRPDVAERLGARVPSLLNAPGLVEYGGLPVPGVLHFHDNLPLRDGKALDVTLADGTMGIIRSPVVNTVPGAMDIQRFVDNSEWVFQSGSSVAHARYVRRHPLPGVPAKSVIVQFAKGDQGNPNPVTTAILRAGRLADAVTFYRHDVAFEKSTGLPRDPHNFLVSLGNAAFRGITLAALSQIAVFFESDGDQIMHPQPTEFFEVPIASLPEELNFIPPPPG